MIHVTGDIHGDYMKLYDACNKLTADDYMIVCGDFGIMFYNDRRDYKKIELLSKLSCTIAFIDGNHENFDMLESCPEEMWCGGAIHRISSNIIHLERGYVFNIDGKTFFTFGGGYSEDRELRTEGVDLWSRELPSEYEYLRGIDSLKAYSFCVDYILTHTGPKFAETALRVAERKESSLQTFLEGIYRIATFNKWYFGHYHKDKTISDGLVAVYNSIYTL